jgi:anti-sigma-K factor RskA
VTGQSREHAQFDELAAGYALHALEPDEELRFLRHAEQCGRCAAALADYAEVAAALAGTAPAAEPSPQLAARIMAAVADEMPRAGQPASKPDAAGRASQGAAAIPQAASPQAGPWWRQPRARRLKLAAAAAAVVIAGAGVWGGLAATGGGTAQRPLAGCVQARQCSEVVLTDAAHQRDATVIISGGSVWLQPASLAADNTTRQVYVLWQITGRHIPLAVGSFDVRPGAQVPIRIGGLAAPYHDTWAFAVSLEHGRTIPASPSHPVALGQVSA